MSQATQPMADPAQAALAPPRAPTAVDDPVRAALQAMLRIEAGIREAHSRDELSHLLANEVRKIARARQIFVFSRTAGSGALQIASVSSIAVPDRNAPMIQMFERIVSALKASEKFGETTEFRLDGYADQRIDGSIAQSYPMRDLLWAPLKARDGTVVAGLLLTREIPWIQTDIVVASRIAATAAHAWVALDHSGVHHLRRLPWRRLAIGIAAAAACALLIPVPMSALAPMEIVPRDPKVVAAPMDGVIAEVLVQPNQPVAKDDVLVRFADTTLRSNFEVATRELAVAEARLMRANQRSFSDVEGRRELAIARAEREVRKADRDYAAEMLAQSELRASADATAVFNDRRDLIGRPVRVGERLMDLAVPGKVVARIDMPAGDVALLEPGAKVKLFLDSDPLTPVSATLTRSDYRATATPGQTAAFRAWAAPETADGATAPRLGVRGTAQVYGGSVPLGFYLLRRPITAVRQWLGM